MSGKRYTDIEIHQFLTLLAFNKFNYSKTSELTGVPRNTLRRWNNSDVKKEIPEILDATIRELLAKLPQTIPTKDFGIIAGILLDKWLIIQGMPTARNESVIGRLGDMDEHELDRIIREAEEIISEASSRGSDTPIS